MPTRDDFIRELRERLRNAARNGAVTMEINAEQLHQSVCGDDHAKSNILACCDAMYQEQRAIDKILVDSLDRNRGALTIRYVLPR